MINILNTLRSNPDFFGELDLNRPSIISSTPKLSACTNTGARRFRPQRYSRGESRATQAPPIPRAASRLGSAKKIRRNSLTDKPQHTRLLQVVQSNIVNDWSLECYARSIGMSVSTFRRVFHEVFDEPSPKAWLVRQRLRYAHAKIKYTNTSMLDIAFDCGFSSQSYFIQAYKKRYGVVPSKVRKKNL